MHMKWRLGTVALRATPPHKVAMEYSSAATYVSQVGLHDLGLFVLGGFHLGLVKLLDQSHGLASEATVELSASP